MHLPHSKSMHEVVTAKHLMCDKFKSSRILQ